MIAVPAHIRVRAVSVTGAAFIVSHSGHAELVHITLRQPYSGARCCSFLHNRMIELQTVVAVVTDNNVWYVCNTSSKRAAQLTVPRPFYSSECCLVAGSSALCRSC